MTSLGGTQRGFAWQAPSSAAPGPSLAAAIGGAGGGAAQARPETRISLKRPQDQPIDTPAA